MKQILTFGDSNTWGLVPGSKPHERYAWGQRWTSILQEKFDPEEVRIAEEGLCGRTTVFEDELRPGRKGVSSIPVLLESHYPIDVLVLMLGTNDCKTYYNASSHTIGLGVERCLDAAERFVSSDHILLISPIHLGDDVWRPEKDPEFNEESIKKSIELKEVYSKIAKRRGISFFAASDYVSPSRVDDEHMDENGHKLFAQVVFDQLKSF